MRFCFAFRAVSAIMKKTRRTASVYFASVAQLDRASPSDGEGCGFDSRRVHHTRGYAFGHIPVVSVPRRDCRNNVTRSACGSDRYSVAALPLLTIPAGCTTSPQGVSCNRSSICPTCSLYRLRLLFRKEFSDTFCEGCGFSAAPTSCGRRFPALAYPRVSVPAGLPKPTILPAPIKYSSATTLFC